MEDLSAQYLKYRWFFTGSGKLVIGGKSAIQNEELLQTLQKNGTNYVVMHTHDPGSPFSVILADIQKVSKEDREECAIFTGCFSRAWRERKEMADVDVFSVAQLEKKKGMKAGTWQVGGKIQRTKVTLALALTLQEKILRAVPIKTVIKKKDVLLTIVPGSIDKQQMISTLHVALDEKFSADAILAALPAGGVKVTAL